MAGLASCFVGFDAGVLGECRELTGPSISDRRCRILTRIINDQELILLEQACSLRLQI